MCGVTSWTKLIELTSYCSTKMCAPLQIYHISFSLKSITNASIESILIQGVGMLIFVFCPLKLILMRVHTPHPPPSTPLLEQCSSSIKCLNEMKILID